MIKRRLDLHGQFAISNHENARTLAGIRFAERLNVSGGFAERSDIYNSNGGTIKTIRRISCGRGNKIRRQFVDT